MKFKNLKIFILLSILVVPLSIPIVIQNSNLSLMGYNPSQISISGENDSWTKRWSILEVDWASSIAVDSIDNIYVLGGTKATQSQERYNFLSKFNRSGDLLWQKLLCNNVSCNYHTIKINSENDIFLVGNLNDNQKEYIILSKYDNMGKQLWNKTWGGYDWLMSYDMEVDSFSNIYIVGSIEVNESNHLDTYLIKLNNAGTILWNQTWGEESYIDEYYTIAADVEDNIFIAGTFSERAILLSYNSSGYLEWNYSWNFPYYEQDILVDSDGYILIADGISLKKINSTGNLLWNYSLPEFSVINNKLIIDNINDIYIAENRRIKCYDNSYFLESMCICTTIYLEKINSSGSKLWERRCTGCADVSCSDIALDSIGNIYITGELKGEFGCTNLVHDAILMKNPKAFVGECVEIYYDLLFVILTPIILVGLIFLIIFIRKRK